MTPEQIIAESKRREDALRALRIGRAIGALIVAAAGVAMAVYASDAFFWRTVGLGLLLEVVSIRRAVER